MHVVDKFITPIEDFADKLVSRPFNVWDVIKTHFVAIERLSFFALVCGLGTYSGNGLVPVIGCAVGIGLLKSDPIGNTIKSIMGDTPKYQTLRKWMKSPLLEEGWKFGCLFRGVFGMGEFITTGNPFSLLKGAFWITWSSIYSHWI